MPRLCWIDGGGGILRRDLSESLERTTLTKVCQVQEAPSTVRFPIGFLNWQNEMRSTTSKVDVQTSLQF